jgi:hypothetical protein
VCLSIVLALFSASSAPAAEPGKAVGTVTINGTVTKLAFASQATVENLFDSAKRDTLVVLTDRALGDTAADDDVELSLKARRGDLVVLALRIDGRTLANVKASYKGLAGYVQLPGTWFQFTPSGKGAGTLKLAKREWDGATYECAVDFAAAPAAVPKPAATAAPTPAPAKPVPAPAPAPLPPATTSNVDPKAATALLVQALMKKDERQALELIKLGANPNGRDQYGVPVLNWAVMMCQPKVVKALVDAKADLTYQRAPGMTIMQEAGACPEAALILKTAGAK